MKPSNFPDRKNQRRKDALARINKLSASGKKKHDHEAMILSFAIKDGKRDVRTKKDRSSRKNSR